MTEHKKQKHGHGPGPADGPAAGGGGSYNPGDELVRLLRQPIQLRPLSDVRPNSLEFDDAEAELDHLMDPNPAEDATIEEYMRKVGNKMNIQQRALFPAIDKVLNKLSETVFMGVAPLGYVNPDAAETNCQYVYPVCLEVTRRDLASVSYLLALRREYNKSNIASIPYIGPLLANIKLATKASSFVISLLSYRYTLIWLNSRLAALGNPVIVPFLRDFYTFCRNPNDVLFEAFKVAHPQVYAILTQVTNQAFSKQTFIILIHQFLSRQNRLAAAAAAAAAGGAPAPAPAAAGGGIPGWNVQFIGILDFLPVAGVVQASAETTLKMFRPEICWAGFDAAPYVQGGITYVDQGLSAMLIRSSTAIEILAPEGNNLFVSAYLKMKYNNTFSMFDGSINKGEFKIVFIQERNKYVSEIMTALTTTRDVNYEQAKIILKDVYPQAFQFSIELEDDGGVSVRSGGSSVWTVRGSTASSMWRADQAVQAQQLVESTVFNWFLRKASDVVRTCSEKIMGEGTMAVATLPGSYEPPIFGHRPTDAQFRALSCAVHAVTVFDQWIDTLQSDTLMSVMSGTTVERVRKSLDRIKHFYRLKCEIRVLENGDIAYVMDADNITSLKDTVRSLILEDDSTCLSAILRYSQEEEAKQKMREIGVAIAAAPAAAAAAPAAEAEQAEVNESIQIALANIIPPAQILDAIAQEEHAGGAQVDDSGPQRDLVEADMDDRLAAQGGRSRSCKRSASKRTRRKGAAKKQKSKKNKRQSRRKARRSSSRNSRK